MSLEQKIATDLKEAMKAKDQAAMRTLRSIKSAILLLKTDGSGEEITEEKEIKMLQKLLKQRNDYLEIFTKKGRDDLDFTEKEKIDVTQRYLPQPLTPEELQQSIHDIIKETGASSIKEMGKVIGLANQRLAGKAEGKTIAEVVKSLLS